MSEENVKLVVGLLPAPDVDVTQLVRDDRAWTAYADPFVAFVHPHLESVRPGLPDGKTYTGLDGLREIWLEWLAPWTAYRVETEDTVDLGDRVLVLAHAFARLEGSEADVENTVAALYTVRDGTIARVEFYLDRDEALKAVGLEP